jgi:hypothetical protein
MNRWRGLLMVVAIGLNGIGPALLAAEERAVEVPPAGRVRRPATPPPAAIGQVASFRADESITVAVKVRGGQTRQTEFRIVDGQTQVELLGDAKEIAAGMPVSVWTIADDPKAAAKIVIGTPPAPPIGMRRPNNRQQPNMQASRGGNNAAIVKPAELTLPAIAPRAPVPGLSPAAIARHIDDLIDARLRSDNVSASPRCDDAEFIRRVYLDVVGIIPPADKSAAFIDSADPHKRAALIDELLAGSQYGTHFAELWCERITSRDLPTENGPFVSWLAASFQQNRRWDEIVRDVLTAEGQFTLATRGKRLSTSDPRALFLVVNTDNNAMQQPRPEWLAAESSRLFLGIQIQCAECHDHPFAAWKQADFWGLAAFFSQFRSVRQPGGGGLAWQESPPPTDAPPRITIPSTSLRSVGTVIPARLLADEHEFQPREGQPLRESLARWITAADNPYFARATVNWLWSRCFGRGLVNPVDDQHADNPPTHPELLTLLADEFARSEFDLKHLVRCILSSQAYQRTSRPLDDAESHTDSYGHMAVKVLRPAELYDSLCQATGLSQLKLGLPERKTKVTTIIVQTPREAFVDFFRSSQGIESSPTEYQHGVPQALKLLNAPQLNRVVPAAERLAQANLTPEQAIEQLTLCCYSRRPTREETLAMAEFLFSQSNGTTAQHYSALLWVLINTSEFVINH